MTDIEKKQRYRILAIHDNQAIHEDFTKIRNYPEALEKGAGVADRIMYCLFGLFMAGSSYHIRRY
ncbi:MAG: hypothetical protein CR981_02270 [Proteobacteria bacterium]|nr:MAG: hypothetical protein CR981_02270 [Pseudomonadota bacterium]